MTKAEFLSELKARLSGLAEADIASSLDYYSEMIDERMEDGMSEAEAVAAIGGVEQAAEQILSEIPLPHIIKSNVRQRGKLHPWEIVLLILGSPLWISLLAALFAVVLAVFVALLAVVISVFAVGIALAVSAVGVAVGSVVLIFTKGIIPALMFLGAALMVAGLALLFWPLIKLICRGFARLCRKFMLWIKTFFLY